MIRHPPSRRCSREPCVAPWHGAWKPHRFEQNRPATLDDVGIRLSLLDLPNLLQLVQLGYSKHSRVRNERVPRLRERFAQLLPRWIRRHNGRKRLRDVPSSSTRLQPAQYQRKRLDQPQPLPQQRCRQGVTVRRLRSYADCRQLCVRPSHALRARAGRRGEAQCRQSALRGPQHLAYWSR